MQIITLNKESAHLLFILYFFPSKFNVFWGKFYSLLVYVLNIIENSLFNYP